MGSVDWAAMTYTQEPDLTWPRRRKSDLVVRPGGQYGMGVYRQRSVPRQQPSSPAAPVQIKIIRNPAPAKQSQDSMWPRRRKSDLMIYQETRIPRKPDADMF